MSIFQKAKTVQWYKAKVLKEILRKPYSGFAKKGEEGFVCVLDDNSVVFWRGGDRDLPVDYSTITTAREFLTCISKCENKTRAMSTAWDRAMF